MELKATTHQLGSNWLKHLKTDGGNDGGSHLVVKQMNRLKSTLYIGDTMKNILVRGIQSKNYGHATKVHNHKVGIDYVEVRMLDNYEHVHTCTIPSFYLCYEVLGDEEV